MIKRDSFVSVMGIAALTALAIVLVCFAPALAQATCESLTGTGRCNSANIVSAIMPITNIDGTPFNDFATNEVIFGPNAGVCGTTVGTTVKNLGPLGVPITPTPNLRATSLLGPIGIPNGKVFLAWRILDLTGNRSGCSSEISFTFDNVASGIPTGLQVGP